MTRHLEEILRHWPSVVAGAERKWAQDFARSIQRQARRRRWRPSPKQYEIMQSMVAELFLHGADDEGDFTVIDDDEGAE